MLRAWDGVRTRVSNSSSTEGEETTIQHRISYGLSGNIYSRAEGGVITLQVIFRRQWRVLFRCADAAEAEARACVEGIRLAAQWVSGS